MKKTFQEWNRMGFKVHKGQKAKEFTDNGDAVFTSEQVYNLEMACRKFDEFADMMSSVEDMPH